jgi:DNA polymerase-1
VPSQPKVKNRTRKSGNKDGDVSERSNNGRNRFVAIDSNSLMHRAYHAYPPNLATSKGLQVNAVYGFTSMLLKVLEELEPKYIVCAFDLAKPTFRHKEFEDYKANRKPPDEALVKQFPIAKEVLEAFNIPILQKEGYEADDILGTLGYWTDHGKWKSKNLEQVIVTGDKDLLQMVDENTKVWLPKGSFKNVKLYDRQEVKNLFDFGPEYVVDYKAMVGDSSDNIPGVSGVGKKTATKFIKEFGHLDEIYNNLDSDFFTERQRKLMREDKESAYLSQKLANIISNLDLNLEIEDCLLKDFDYEEVVDKFRELEFRSLLKKIPEAAPGNNIEEGNGQMGIFAGGGQKTSSNSNRQDEESQVPDIKQIKDLEISEDTQKIWCLYFRENDVMLISTSNDDVESFYFQEDVKACVEIRDTVKTIITSNLKKVVFYGWKDFCKVLFDCDYIGENGERDFETDLFNFSKEVLLDVQLAAYFLSAGTRNYSFKELAFNFGGYIFKDNDADSKKLTGKYIEALKTVEKEINEKLVQHNKQKRFIEIEDESLGNIDGLRDVDHPLAISCRAMSDKGIKVDVDILKGLQKDFDKKTKDIEKEIFESVGHEFNVASPKQLSEVLFEELELPPQKRTKTGYSTNEKVLSSLKDLHPCVEMVLEYREVVKLNSTYVKPLLDYAENSRDGRIHSTFNQISTATGRLSSTEPNLQNIPVRTDLGKKIKEAFVAPDGKILVSADYSQIELRVMAHLSKDAKMIEDFKSGKDFHSLTAKRLLDIEEGSITKDDRRVAKTINFGVLYGQTPYGLSRQLEIDRSQAEEYINSYFEKFSGVRDYLDKTIAYARREGHLETILGRRKYFGGVNSSNNRLRAAAEREAINFPIQGTAADIMRIAMNNVYEKLINELSECSLILQIHDELVVECAKGKEDEIKTGLKRQMADSIELDVPLLVDVSSGNNLRK